MSEYLRKSRHLINFLPEAVAEMSRADHEFLGGMLHRYKPSKILEIGVAAGGTSAFILHNTGKRQKVFSVDIATEYYRDKSKPVGWQLQELCTDEQQLRHQLFLGKDIVEVIPEIGGGIDFCLLDTNHVLPGELLQFFAIYPFLKDGAVLVMHDISINMHYSINNKESSITPYQRAAFATKVLFTSIGSRQKILPNAPLPNIGAVIIDEHTRAYIESTFFALGITWCYYPKKLISLYKDFIASNYSIFCQNVFEQCILTQKNLAEHIW